MQRCLGSIILQAHYILWRQVMPYNDPQNHQSYTLFWKSSCNQSDLGSKSYVCTTFWQTRFSQNRTRTITSAYVIFYQNMDQNKWPKKFQTKIAPIAIKMEKYQLIRKNWTLFMHYSSRAMCKNMSNSIQFS